LLGPRKRFDQLALAMRRDEVAGRTTELERGQLGERGLLAQPARRSRARGAQRITVAPPM
jgi:hypothetical protein